MINRAAAVGRGQDGIGAIGYEIGVGRRARPCRALQFTDSRILMGAAHGECCIAA